MSNWAIIPSDSDVMHRSHKYIEKVRTTKGGWRYIYKKPKYKSNAKNSLGIKERSEWKSKESNSQNASEEYKKKLAANEVARQNRMESDLTDEQKRQAAANALNRLNQAKQGVKNAEIDAKRAEEAYRATTLGKLEYSAKAGAEIISDFIKTFPQMAATKMSYLLNGSPYNTKTPYKADDSWKKGTNYTPPSVHKNPSYIPKSFTNDMDKFMNDYNKKNNTNYTRKTPTSSNNFQFGLKPDEEKLKYYKNLKFRR